ncbi:MAG TPA: hypothetical protein VH413_08795 [Verrucomicrobiae bacterium]|jgi:hypothetical protein|nr:hypothetical protein [Verrucomicrobiae bacterium]
MKITDDYNAKVRLWAANPQISPVLPGPELPAFPPQKFRSHAEMNAWKAALLRSVAEITAKHD